MILPLRRGTRQRAESSDVLKRLLLQFTSPVPMSSALRRNVGPATRSSAPSAKTFSARLKLNEQEEQDVQEDSFPNVNYRDLDDWDHLGSEGVPFGEALDSKAAPMLLTAVKAAYERKGIDIIALRIDHVTVWPTYMMAVSARSVPQIKAVMNEIEDNILIEHDVRAKREGSPEGGWISLVYDHIIVNIFTEERREHYDLEHYWKDGQKVDLSSYLEEDLPGDASSSKTEDWEISSDDDWTLDDSEFEDDWSVR